MNVSVAHRQRNHVSRNGNKMLDRKKITKQTKNKPKISIKTPKWQSKALDINRDELVMCGRHN